MPCFREKQVRFCLWLPKAAVESPSLKGFKRCIDEVPRDMV